VSDCPAKGNPIADGQMPPAGRPMMDRLDGKKFKIFALRMQFAQASGKPPKPAGWKACGWSLALIISFDA
jgi:hypothetical protein